MNPPGTTALRVVIVTDTMHPFVIGGKEHRHFQLAKGLIKNGASVVVYTTKCWHGPRRIRIAGIEFVGLSRDHPRYAGSRRTVWQALTFSIACLRLLTERFDVIDADAIPLLPVMTAWLVARLRRRPMVVTFHEVWPAAYWISYAGRLLGPACAIAQLAALHLPDAIVAGSAETARRIRPYGRSHVVTIESGADTEVLDATPATGPWSDLLYAGHLMPHKRVDLAVEALRVLADRGRRLTLLIVGTGPEEAFLGRLVTELGLADSVSLQHPWADRRRFVSALKSCKIMVMPSAREGFGIAVFEALTLGIPVVIANDGGNLATALVRPGDRASVVAPDPHSFATAIQYWLERPGRPRQDRQAGRRDWDRCARETLDVYTDLRA